MLWQEYLSRQGVLPVFFLNQTQVYASEPIFFVRFVPICEISCSIKSNSMFLSALRAEIVQIFPNLTNHEMLADVVFVVVIIIYLFDLYRFVEFLPRRGTLYVFSVPYGQKSFKSFQILQIMKC